jgi:hypothetical protein
LQAERERRGAAGFWRRVLENGQVAGPKGTELFVKAGVLRYWQRCWRPERSRKKSLLGTCRKEKEYGLLSSQMSSRRGSGEKELLGAGN